MLELFPKINSESSETQNMMHNFDFQPPSPPLPWPDDIIYVQGKIICKNEFSGTKNIENDFHIIVLLKNFDPQCSFVPSASIFNIRRIVFTIHRPRKYEIAIPYEF